MQIKKNSGVLKCAYQAAALSLPFSLVAPAEADFNLMPFQRHV